MVVLLSKFDSLKSLLEHSNQAHMGEDVFYKFFCAFPPLSPTLLPLFYQVRLGFFAEFARLLYSTL